MTEPLSWYSTDLESVMTLMQEVSEADGVCSFMFGGHGHYYKISWSIGGVHDFISAETPERISALAREASSTGRSKAPRAHVNKMAKW